MKFNIIAAVDDCGGLGKEGKIPWHSSEDLKFFKEVTTKVSSEDKLNVVIMGRKTFESLDKPLPDRINIVLTRQDVLNQWALPYMLASSLDEALGMCSEWNEVENVFVIGGAEVYAEAIKHPKLDLVYLSHIPGNFDCDVFFSRKEILDTDDFERVDSPYDSYDFILLRKKSV